MKKCLSNAAGEKIGGFGFDKPGHSLKGRQHLLSCDKDLNDMYCIYKKRRDVTLWCFRPTVGGPEASSSNQKSRKHSLSKALQPRPKSQCAQKIKDVEDLIRQLKERHGKVFTTEQLSCWAHIYHMDKHGSLETPPDTPFFTGCLKKKKTSTCTDDDRSVVPCASGISPRKRVNLRTESIKQLVGGTLSFKSVRRHAAGYLKRHQREYGVTMVYILQQYCSFSPSYLSQNFFISCIIDF